MLVQAIATRPGPTDGLPTNFVPPYPFSPLDLKPYVVFGDLDVEDFLDIRLMEGHEETEETLKTPDKKDKATSSNQPPSTPPEEKDRGPA